MYSSDYGYAVGEDMRSSCISKSMLDWRSECYQDNWVFKKAYIWLITPNNSSNLRNFTLDFYGLIAENAGVNGGRTVWPVVYLKKK